MYLLLHLSLRQGHAGFSNSFLEFDFGFGDWLVFSHRCKDQKSSLKKKTKHFDHHHYSFWEIMSEPSMSGSDPQACGGTESSTTQGAIILQDHAVSQRFRDKLNHCPVTQPSGWSGAVSDQPIIFTWNKKKNIHLWLERSIRKCRYVRAIRQSGILKRQRMTWNLPPS